MATLQIKAPADMDPLEIAQAVIGPQQIVRTEYDRSNAGSTWARHRSLGELHALEVRAYRALFARMVRAIEHYIETHIVHGKLVKAAPPNDWVLVSPEQLEALRGIIGDYHEAYIAGMLNPALLDGEQRARLLEAGILPPELAQPFVPGAGEAEGANAERPLEQAYRYGRELAAASPGALGRLKVEPYSETRERPKVQLSSTEREAIRWAEEHAAEYVRGLSKRVAADLTSRVVTAATQLGREHTPAPEQPETYELGHSALTREDIGEVLVSNLERQRAWRTIVTDLGDKSGDWSRDLGRIAATEKQRAMEEGLSRGLQKRRKADKQRVAKQPAADCCDHCARLYLTAGRGSPPRIYLLSQLIANGSNVGRKARDWLPVVGPTHPWCQCTLLEVPEGWLFDDDGQMVPEILTRGEMLERNLQKSAASWAEKPATYGDSVPSTGIAVRVADPHVRAVVEDVVRRTPAALFDRLTGVTLITTDHDRETTPLASNDYAYWAGNEIRLMQTLPAAKARRVLEHELGHAVNVRLFHKLGSVDAVRAWHDTLWAITKREGYVSRYAQREPIENAAEVARWYLYYRRKLMLDFPRQFAFLHRAFGSLL